MTIDNNVQLQTLDNDYFMGNQYHNFALRIPFSDITIGKPTALQKAKIEKLKLKQEKKQEKQKAKIDKFKSKGAGFKSESELSNVLASELADTGGTVTTDGGGGTTEKSNTWIWVVSGIAVVGIIGAIIYFKKKK